MYRALLITFVWLALLALVVGVAHLARPCDCEHFGARAPAHLSLTAVQPRAIATLVADPAPVTQAKHPSSHEDPPASVSPAASPANARTSSNAVAASLQEPTSGTSTPAPAPKQDPPARAPKKQRPPPDDPGDNGSNGGLGVLPPGPEPEYEGLGVSCVSVSTGRPIADVQVRAMTTKEIDAWSSAHPGQSVDDEDPKVVLEAAKPAVKTNTYGITITESGPGRMLVDARLGLLYAHAWVDRNKLSQVKLVMVEDHDLVFETHAPDGSARAGVPVVVRDVKCKEIWRGVTQGDAASVRMRHAAFLLERDAAPGPCSVRIEGVLPSSPTFTFERTKLPTDAIELVMPPAISVVVHVKDPKGAPVHEPVEVTLQSSAHGPGCGYDSKRTTRDGEATFERVQPDAVESLWVHADGGDVYESISPKVEAGKHDITVSFARAFPVARMQLKDGEGKPLANTRVKVWLDLHGQAETPAGHGEFTTKADGSLSVPIGAAGPSWPATGEKENWPPPSDLFLVQLDPTGDTIASATVPVPADFTNGVRDLGAAAMKPLPFVVQGYVVDDRDSAVAGAHVSLEVSDGDAVARKVAPDEAWQAVSDFSGFFKLRAEIPDQHIELDCIAADHAPTSKVAVQRGDKKVRIVAQRFGTLVSKFLLPPGLPSDFVTVYVGSIGSGLSSTLRPGEICRVVDLPPAKLKVLVYVRGLPDPALTVEDVEVKPGAEVSDPRVNPIDLRQLLYYRTLHVNDPDGKPVPSLLAKVIEPGTPKVRHDLMGGDGVVGIVSKQASVDVEISAPGFVTRTLHDVDKGVDVTLERTP